MMSSTTSAVSAAALPQQLPSQSRTFKPKSEWVHENEAKVLFLYLPGFTMEQLTISPEYSKQRVKVEGKRRLPNNRLLPVNETFNIPDDCDLSNMLKQFEKGEKKDQTDDANKKAADESNENGKEYSSTPSMPQNNLEKKDQTDDANKRAADESNENGKEYSSTPSMPQNNLQPSSPDVNLMVNVGAAVLILMGLGASLFYTISH
ncbi:hypothetical protein E1A91_D04G023100v1 [Gossypium mustelinum]|uniref:SHSP domain-containing protein n=1 Tax=Gossypium mustelinum TaxID=34275 RepID=A0A5D2V963_GOSMU|nr:hypothetical protein E1A91_D04G023100v1 [Gossypium mustelinum]